MRRMDKKYENVKSSFVSVRYDHFRLNKNEELVGIIPCICVSYKYSVSNMFLKKTEVSTLKKSNRMFFLDTVVHYHIDLQYNIV